MKILVSGGAGYIGSWLTKLLLEQGHTVGVITRNQNNFTELYKYKISLYISDITKPFIFETAENYDLFIHLAAANDIDSADPAYALNASALGTRFALDFCRNNSISKFIYFSTFQVFGRVEGEMNENSPLLPVNDYGITHQFAEQYIEMFNRTSGIEYIILRPTNIFGAPMFSGTDRWTLVPSCFCKEAVEKNEINLMSSGKQNRDFIDVNDLASVTALFAKDFDKYSNSVINISSGNKFTISEIAQIVADIYSELYKKPCPVKILSENPKQENHFTICRKVLNRTGFEFGTREIIKKEIKNIFKLLKTK
jgi:UDP-glucose 4-epimerase